MMDQVKPFFLSRRPKTAPANGVDHEPVRERSTAPDAPMTLFMRIQTEKGPRTVVASALTLTAASEISEALILAGHYAEFVDQCSTEGSISERVQRKMEDQSGEPKAGPRLEIVSLGDERVRVRN